MGAKQKRRKALGPDKLLERARRELAKGNTKDALKDARVSYRNASSPECRQLLEEAYLARTEQLYSLRLHSEAGATLGQLIELGPTVAVVCEQIPRWRTMLGIGGEDSSRLLEEDPLLLVEMTDKAVLDDRYAPPEHRETKLEVEQIRLALAAVEHGDDGAAREMVRGIPRSSSLCDWKLLVRGLSAFYQGDEPRVEENWRRLDPSRPAWQIARTLSVATDCSFDKSTEEARGDVAASVRRLEKNLQSDPAVERLRRLAEYWRQGKWCEYFREYGIFRQRFSKTHKALIETIVELTWKRAAREGDWEMLDKLAGNGPAPAMDPNWNRARALLAEDPEDLDVTETIDHWMAYAEEVGELSCLHVEERPLAAGCVYLHLARLQLRFALENEGLASSPLGDGRDDESIELFREAAADALGKAIECGGQLAAAYHELARLHNIQGNPAQGAMVLRELVREKPEDYEAHVWLADHYLRENEPGESERHTRAARDLRPRDERTTTLCWNQHLAMIRCLVKNRQFEAARRELQEAADRIPAEIEPYTLDTIRAGIELKAGNETAAQQFVEAALGRVEEPAAIWLQLSCTAARYKLSRDVKKGFDDRFKKAIGRKPKSRTAGRIARFLAGLNSAQINYTGRATQERLFLKYLGRAKRLSWEERDLCDVCFFLTPLSKQASLRKKFIARGVKRFPDCARLQLFAGSMEMDAGPFRCRFGKARRHMERAIELARRSDGPPDEEIIGSAQRALAVLDSSQSGFLGGIFDDDEGEFDNGEPGGFAGAPDISGIDLGIKRIVKMMHQMMSSEQREQIEQLAATKGVSVEELMQDMLEKGVPPEMEEAGERE